MHYERYSVFLIAICLSALVSNCQNSGGKCGFIRAPIVNGADDATLVAEQYYIKSTQLDLNLGDLDSMRKGAGIKIAVVDDGVEINHSDLNPNINPLGNLNLFPGIANQSNCIDNPTSDPQAMQSHGTQVAGIISARDGNSLGIRGIAPRSQLSGINFLAANNMTSNNHFIQVVEKQITSGTMVSTNSYGSADDLGMLSPPNEEQDALLTMGATMGNKNKGINFLFAGGNGGHQRFPVYINPTTMVGEVFISMKETTEENKQELENLKGVPFLADLKYPFDASYHEARNSHHQVMAIASVNRTGIKSGFSEKGSNIWISAFGEEITTTTINNLYARENDEANPQFIGTSAATPVVSGAIALILAENPSFSYRDIRLILAESALKNDPHNPEWITNNATKISGNGGYNFNNNYGFGLVDVGAARTIARNWIPISGKLLKHDTRVTAVNKTFVDGVAAGMTQNITVADSSITRIEYMQVYVATRGANHGDLEIIISGSNGTMSTLAEPHFCAEESKNPEGFRTIGSCLPPPEFRMENSADYSNGGDGWRFGNVAHLGETANQTWTIKVADINKDLPNMTDPIAPTLTRMGVAGQNVDLSEYQNNDTDSGIFVSARIVFYGR